MRRLFLFVWLALSLATVSGPAFAAPSPDCPMATAPSGMASHDGMDCCKPTCAPDCAAVCPGVMVPTWSMDTNPAGLTKSAYHLGLAPEPLSAMLAGADPPPRTTIS